MVKKIKTVIKLSLPAGKATPSPPVGPILGQHGVNIGAFCKDYNAKTAESIGIQIPIKMTIYEDKSYIFVLKSPPTAALILKFAEIKKGSSKPGKDIVGNLSYENVTNIIKIKEPDLKVSTLEKAIKTIQGSATSMGVKFLVKKNYEKTI